MTLDQYHGIAQAFQDLTAYFARVVAERRVHPRDDLLSALAHAEEAGKRLRDHMKAASVGAAPVYACVGRDRVVLREIRYPQVPASEEPAIVRFQVEKELTEPPQTVVIDYMRDID